MNFYDAGGSAFGALDIVVGELAPPEWVMDPCVRSVEYYDLVLESSAGPPKAGLGCVLTMRLELADVVSRPGRTDGATCWTDVLRHLT